MWLKYQQLHAKMASFDPREMLKSKGNESAVKHPYSRFEPTLKTSLKIVIPSNLSRLKKHKVNIEKYAWEKDWRELNKEQINASRTVQQLKATVRELDNIKYQVRDQDLILLEKAVKPIKEQALKGIQDFASVQEIITNGIRNQQQQHNNVIGPESRLLPEPSDDIESFTSTSEPLADQLHLSGDATDQELNACESWDGLRENLVELNSLVHDFAALVHHQQEYVDRIEENIEVAHANVHSGAKILGQASKYKAAVFPVGGAVVGGLLGGPIGMLAGFKLAGVVTAAGCAVAGYTGGRYLKRKHDERVDIELSNLSKND